jgi:hypothetical protein
MGFFELRLEVPSASFDNLLPPEDASDYESTDEKSKDQR